MTTFTEDFLQDVDAEPEENVFIGTETGSNASGFNNIFTKRFLFFGALLKYQLRRLTKAKIDKK